jgi:fatty acid hydroxylase family protein
LTTETEIRDTATRNAQNKKRINAVAAALCGFFPALWLWFQAHPTWQGWLLGLALGLIWGNAFEYAYHRFLLHRPRTQHGAAHQKHHAEIDTPEEAEYVALISSPLNIVLLFVINGVPAFLISFLLGQLGILCGVFTGWSVYVILCEEIHWRIHMNGWLPPGLHFARAYHMSHHDIPTAATTCFYLCLICCSKAAMSLKANLPDRKIRKEGTK